MILDETSRRIFWGGEVTSDLAEQLVHSLYKLDATKGDIEMILTGSDGGNWEDAGAGICAAMLGLQNEISTYSLGMQASSAALIFLAADARYMDKNGILMFHDGSMGVEGNLRDVESLSPTIRRQREMDYEFLSSKSCRPPSFWQEQLSQDRYIFAEEALQLELIQAICTI